MSIRLDILGIQGHESRVFDDVEPENRNALGRTVEGLMRKSYQCFLRNPDDTRVYRIIGYDDHNQAWITSLEPHVLSADQVVSAVPPIAGG